jgi:hypothetical protein
MNEAHLCCGSAGTYSVLHPELATALRDRKLGHLAELAPETIVSANIGCIQHLPERDHDSGAALDRGSSTRRWPKLPAMSRVLRLAWVLLLTLALPLQGWRRRRWPPAPCPPMAAATPDPGTASPRRGARPRLVHHPHARRRRLARDAHDAGQAPTRSVQRRRPRSTRRRRTTRSTRRTRRTRSALQQAQHAHEAPAGRRIAAGGRDCRRSTVVPSNQKCSVCASCCTASAGPSGPRRRRRSGALRRRPLSISDPGSPPVFLTGGLERPPRPFLA